MIFRRGQGRLPDLSAVRVGVAALSRARGTRWRAAALVVLIAAAGGWLHVNYVAELPGLDAPLRLPWVVLVAGFVAVCLCEVRFAVRGHLLAVSLEELPILFGLFFADPLSLVTAAVSGTLIGVPLASAAAPDRLKLLFNTALCYFQTVVAVLVFSAVLGSASAVSSQGRLAAVAAVLVVPILTNLLVPLAIMLSGGKVERGTIAQFLLATAASAFTNVTLGLLAVTLLWLVPDAAWLLVGLAVLIAAAHRAHDRLRARHESMRRLHAVTRGVSAAVAHDELVGSVLDGAAELLGAQRVVLVLVSGDVIVLADGETFDDSLPPGDVERLLAQQPAVVPADADAELRSALARLRLTDAVVARLETDEQLVGVVLAGERVTAERRFNNEDVRLLEMFSAHVAVALLNSRLVEELRRQALEREHEARHDPLTGLPNRSSFKATLAALLSHGEPEPFAVMLMDLDGFKEVNDTLGHHTGDVLLCEIGARLARTLGDSATVARLGGDEFAIVVRGLTGELTATTFARHLLDMLEEPYLVEDNPLHMTASVGIALSPGHGDERTQLLRRADVAMYAAKSNYSQVEVYRESSDPYRPERLALVSELRSALEAGELTVAYQPKADLRTGRVVGAEALARWHHPERGYIPPEEFINVAERTGLIVPLTTHVLRTALHQARVWRLLGLELDIAVNLSLRSLSVDLPSVVQQLVDEAGVPASALTLEITETAIMTDPARTGEVLEILAAMGVTLSIDDFGTGYSSLAHLKRLPVSEIKVDRSFVMTMSSDASDAAIVRSTVDLARNLGLRVVAEGVEDAEAWSTLATLGCDYAQGFHLSPPLSPEELVEWCAKEAEAEAKRVPVRVRRGLPAQR